MVAVPGYSKEEISAAVKDMYTIVAQKPESPLHFPIGREAAILAGYSEEQIGDLPASALECLGAGGGAEAAKGPLVEGRVWDLRAM